jgi:hypothetical protein
MTQLIKYVYYRIAHALLNLNQWEKGYYDVHAMIYLSLCIVSNIALLIMLICNWVFNISIHDSYVFYSSNLVVIVIICMILAWRIWPDDKTYESLDQRYKGEKHRVIKGWFVFAYCVLSFFSLIVFIIIYA